MPLISLVIPIYNNTKYFPNCIESILNQEFQDYEVVIVDDGSTDDTPMLVDSYAKKDSRIRVIHQENQWIYASMNNGIKAAKGEYIYLVGSDDKLTDNCLKILSDIVNKYHPDVIWTNVNNVTCDENQNPVQVTGKTVFVDTHYPEDVYLESREKLHMYWGDLYRYGYIVNATNLWKRDIMLKHPLKEDIFAADMLFDVNAANEIETSYILSEPVYNFHYYQCENMNAGEGKLYGYEVEMYREILKGHVDLVKGWDETDIETVKLFEKSELDTCLNSMDAILSAPKFGYSSEEKLYLLFEKYLTDDFISDFVDLPGAIELIDARITAILLKIVFSEDKCENSKYSFIYDFFRLIMKADKTDEEIKTIKNSVFNELNRCNIGYSLAKKGGIL